MCRLFNLILREAQPWKYLSFFFIGPFIVSYDSTETSYFESQVGAGGGRYRHVDCRDSYNKEYGDIGMQLTKKTSSPFKYGLSLGVGNNYFFAYPVLGVEWKTFAIGTTGIRAGVLNQTYLELGMANQIPFGSGRGLINLGINFPLGNPMSSLWVGATGGYPYKSVGIGIQPEFRVGENRFLFFNGRYGDYRGHPEFGASIGLRIRSF